MAKDKLIRQLFMGKVCEVIGFEKTEELMKETLEALSHLPHSEQVFTIEEIERLQSEVHKITGPGEVMGLFNKLLGINA